MASPSDAADPKDLDAEMARRHELWMAKHQRVYKDEAEKARRFEIFKKNIKHIEDFNRAGKHKYTLGEGPFTDLTSEEFKTTYASGCKVPEPEEEEEEETEKPLGAPLPSSVDRETEGAVTEVENQGGSGKKSIL